MNTHPIERTDMKSMIEQAQKDAYNQALEDAAENAKKRIEESGFGRKPNMRMPGCTCCPIHGN